MFRALCLAAAVAGSLLAGCSSLTFEPHPTLEGLPEVKKSALHAGVYYSPQFAAYDQVRRNGNIDVHVSIGAASVKYFDALLPRLFEKSDRVQTLSASELAKKGVDVVLAPSLEHFDFPMALEPYSPHYGVAYRITLITPRGVPIASWVVSGTADHWKMFGGHLEAYMQNAGAELLRRFDRESAPALAALAAHRERAAPIDTAALGFAARRVELDELGPDAVQAVRQAGFVCIEVSAAPQSARALRVRASDMRLRLKDGRVLEASPPSALLVIARTSPMQYYGPSIVGTLVTLAASSSASEHSSKERESLDSVAERAFFGERVLHEHTRDGGVVFFRLPEKAVADGAVLSAWVVDPASADGAQIELPVAPAKPLR